MALSGFFQRLVILGVHQKDRSLRQWDWPDYGDCQLRSQGISLHQLISISLLSMLLLRDLIYLSLENDNLLTCL